MAFFRIYLSHCKDIFPSFSASVVVFIALRIWTESESTQLLSAQIPNSKRPTSQCPNSEFQVPSSKRPSSKLQSSKLPSSELLSSRLPSSKLPSSRLPTSELPVSEHPSFKLPTSESPVPSVHMCPSAQCLSSCLHSHLCPMSTHPLVCFKPAISYLTPHSGLRTLPLHFPMSVSSTPLLRWGPFSTNKVICWACYTIH